MAGDDVPEVGDKASWNWNGATPSGEVSEKKTEGEVAVQSKRGNTIKKDAKPDDPAIALVRPGNDVVKNQSELQVEEKKAGGGGDETKGEDKKEESKGKKRKAEDEEPEANGDGKKAKAGKPEAAEKKTKSAPKAAAENGDKKPRGRPKGQGAAKKEKKPPAPPTGVGKRTRSQKEGSS